MSSVGDCITIDAATSVEYLNGGATLAWHNLNVSATIDIDAVKR